MRSTTIRLFQLWTTIAWCFFISGNFASAWAPNDSKIHSQPQMVHFAYPNNPAVLPTGVVFRMKSSAALVSHKSRHSRLFLKKNDDDGDETIFSSLFVNRLAIAIQPIVWISLLNVATTGAGLPAGPFGLLGAIEGLAYLAVVVSAAKSLFSVWDNAEETPLSERLSRITIALGLLVLTKLIVDQGCVPNAKPLLDYSNYVKVCDANIGGTAACSPQSSCT